MLQVKNQNNLQNRLIFRNIFYFPDLISIKNYNLPLVHINKIKAISFLRLYCKNQVSLYHILLDS